MPTNLVPTNISSNTVDIFPRNLDKILHIAVIVEFEGLIADQKSPNLPANAEVGLALCLTFNACVEGLNNACSFKLSRKIRWAKPTLRIT